MQRRDERLRFQYCIGYHIRHCCCFASPSPARMTNCSRRANAGPWRKDQGGGNCCLTRTRRVNTTELLRDGFLLGKTLCPSELQKTNALYKSISLAERPGGRCSAVLATRFSSLKGSSGGRASLEDGMQSGRHSVRDMASFRSSTTVLPSCST